MIKLWQFGLLNGIRCTDSNLDYYIKDDTILLIHIACQNDENNMNTIMFALLIKKVTLIKNIEKMKNYIINFV